ncbi:MAG TPA: ABC transporter substrate-binding protein [Candidatus Nitrosotalea sp.]|nr:ABC transporter substrate-binding protein [Candidatus Nitrosotalea sp.]
MDRRTFVATLATGLLASPLVAEAQPIAGIPRVGLLRPGTPSDPADRSSVGAFLAGLQEAGYTRGKNVRIEVRYAHGKFDGLQALARELAALPVDALVTSNPYATQAVREASQTVPIVVALDYETDPVASGWIATIARPGGNLTGFFLDQPEMTGKLLQLLKEGVPGLVRVGVLWDETIGRTQFDATQEAVRVKGLVLKPIGVKRSEDLADAFSAASRERADCLIVLTSPLLSLHRARICELALKHRLPGITLFTNFPAFGLLMAYGPNQPDAFRRSASHYVAQILKGARPADLPVQRPEKFEFVVNLKTAKALGLTIPPSLLVRADQVIQ